MSFHKKALIAFLIFHIVVTLGGLLVGFLQTYPEPTNDRDMISQGVRPYVWVLFCTVISFIGLGSAYLIRAITRLVSQMRKSAIHPQQREEI